MSAFETNAEITLSEVNMSAKRICLRSEHLSEEEMSHYEVLTSETEELISSIYAVYIQFYKTKQEFVKKREAFVKILSEQKDIHLDIKQQGENENEQSKIIHDDILVNNTSDESNTKVHSSPLFHKLALATHPDKHPECHPVYFQQAQKANEQGKLGKLIFLCRLLRIEISSTFTSEERKMLLETIEKKKKKIEHYKKTYPWLYAHADTEELRKKIVEAFCRVNAH